MKIKSNKLFRPGAVLGFAVGMAISASALEITRDFSIVIPDEDVQGIQPWLAYAARELANDIDEATGMKLSVRTAAESKNVSRAIFIGAVFAAKAGLPAAKRDWEPMENAVAEKGGNVYLYGYDCCVHPEAPERPDWRYRCLPSVRAVCNFMEKEMGVFIAGPGRTGRDVAKLEKLEVADGLYRREKPRVISGIGRFHEMISDIANGIFGFCRTFTYGGHTYPAAVPWKKYHETHPEYFPSDGTTRTTNDLAGALCISNPDVENLIVEELLRKFDAGAEAVQLGQQDSKDFCRCPDCMKFGNTDDIGEKFWIFHRRIAERLHRLRPEKTVHILSYMATRVPPKTFTEFPPNVMIELTEYTPESFRVWSRYKVPRGFTNYVYIFGNYRFLGHAPRCSALKMAYEARRYCAAGMKATYRCGYGDLYGMDGQGYYVFNRLLLDPTLDENALADDYVKRMYGPAAGEMKLFHDLLNERLAAYSKIREGYDPPGKVKPLRTWTGRPVDYFAYLYPKDRLDSFDRWLSSAEAHPDLTEKQRRRLALVRLEFTYVANLAKIIHLYNAYRFETTEEMYRPLAAALRERNRFLSDNCDAEGNPKGFPGWPEIQPFGCDAHFKDTLKYNGWGDAPMKEPLGWDPDNRPTTFAKGRWD